MELSLFLAKIFGIYLLTFAALLVIRGKAFVKLLEEFLQDRKLVFLSGTILLAIGLAMAITVLLPRESCALVGRRYRRRLALPC
jgi:hypothetical protein